MSSSIYEHEIEMQDGSQKTFGDVAKGKVTMVVNVASKCGFTPQYKGLQELYRKYKDEGLEILAVPCNQFGGQEPGSASTIRSFTCEVYRTTFPFMSKVEVNGEKAHPLYKQLKAEAPYSLTQAVWWNFEKMIVDRDGKVVSRYGSSTTPAGLESEIKTLLAKEATHKAGSDDDRSKAVAEAPSKEAGAAAGGGGGGGADEKSADEASGSAEEAAKGGAAEGKGDES